jgi:hypothetical protein
LHIYIFFVELYGVGFLILEMCNIVDDTYHRSWKIILVNFFWRILPKGNIKIRKWIFYCKFLIKNSLILPKIIFGEKISLEFYMLFTICNGPMKKCLQLSWNLCWDACHYGSSQVFQKVNINNSQLNFHNVS